MTRRFLEVYRLEWGRRATTMGLSRHQVVTLASIIEKESGNKDEMALISAVFHSRLKNGLKLMSDPTVIYGLDNFNGNLTKKNLRYPSPYNTYINYGLPPGPISNPGKESLLAALWPAHVDYLYFVSKNDGTHYFSRTYKEHQEAVFKYQMRKR